MRNIYLDYAATTPLDKEVKKAMELYFGGLSAGGFGNPNSLHYFGQKARAAVDMSRQKISESIGANFNDVIFTGSATEANNLAFRGVLKAIAEQRRIERRMTQNKIPQPHFLKGARPRIIISSIEHESILETARDLEQEGVEVIVLPVNKNGIVDLKKLKESLTENTILVSIMYANNEIGVVQPIAEIVKIIRNFRSTKHEARNSKQILNSKNKIQNEIVSDFGFRISDFEAMYPLLHIDAVQAFQFLNCNVNDLGVDMMTLSAHKIYGPKGVGALYINSKHEVRNSRQIQNSNMKKNKQKVSDFGFRISDLPVISSLVTGGGQEFSLRSGTENVAAIAGFAKAIELADKNREKEFKRILMLKNYFIKELKKIYPKAQINGLDKFLLNFEERVSAKPNFKMNNEINRSLPLGRNLVEIKSLPNIINIYFSDHKAEDLLIKLDMAGVAVSSGSACASFSAKPSHVLVALGYPEKRIKSSLRFSFGKFITKEEITKTLKILKNLRLYE